MKGWVSGNKIEVDEGPGRRDAQGNDACPSFEEREEALVGGGWEKKSGKKLIYNETGFQFGDYLKN